jgi:hypothetical protein
MTMRNLVNAFVLAIIMVVVGSLLITAIGRICDAAARTTCGNNLHQIAMSLHNYDAINQHLPKAAAPDLNLPAQSRFSWQFTIAPYIQADNLYDRMDGKKGWDAEENRYLAVRGLRTFQCPSYPDRQPESTFVPTHFVGIAGWGADSASLSKEDPRAGFFGDERELSMAQIEDRRSTLLVAMETSQGHGAWTAAGWPTVRGLEPGAAPYLGINGQFGGNHAGLANALVVDGSVRRIRDTIDPSVLEAIATIKGSRGADPGSDW